MKKYLTLDIAMDGRPTAPMVLIFPEEENHGKVLRAAQASVRAHVPSATSVSVRGAGFVHIGEHCHVSTFGDCPELCAQVSPGDDVLISQFLLAAAR